MKRKEPSSTEDQIRHHAALIIAILLALLGIFTFLLPDPGDPVSGYALLVLAAMFIPIWLGQRDANS